MYSKIFVPVDFSPYSAFQLLLAERWGLHLKAELVLVHVTRIYIPGMADGEARENLKANNKQEVMERFEELLATGISSDISVKFHISEDTVTDTLRQLIKQNENALICTGLKGKGLLQRLFMDSTTIDIIDHFNKPVLTVPKNISSDSFEHFLVAVNPENLLNTTEFDQLIGSFKKNLKSLKFITVLDSEAKKKDADQYLKTLEERYRDELPTSYQMYGGEQAFLQVKAVMQHYKNSLLLVQRGSRNLSDQLFRSFFVNDIVYDASIPMLMIPTRNA
jgi:nucleotide-binding universal stress UspA family protein